jgi:alpha-beta hydrolase superfamily lysophospholipase
LLAPRFRVSFQRRIVTARYRGAVVETPMHVLSPADAGADTPVMIASGGLDTWKMDLHRDELLATQDNCPMLVINGDADVHVQIADTKVFNGRPNTQAEVIPGGSHCAVNKLDQIKPDQAKFFLLANGGGGPDGHACPAAPSAGRLIRMCCW